MMGGGHHMMAFGHHMMGLAIILHHMMSYDGWWFLYVFLCAETLSKKIAASNSSRQFCFLCPDLGQKALSKRFCAKKRANGKAMKATKPIKVQKLIL